MQLVFALTLFTSAPLLFVVQPLFAKMVLPLLGGTPAVWNTCMVFYQAALLAGYAYAHLATRWLGGRPRGPGPLFSLRGLQPGEYAGPAGLSGAPGALPAPQDPEPALDLRLWGPG